MFWGPEKIMHLIFRIYSHGSHNFWESLFISQPVALLCQSMWISERIFATFLIRLDGVVVGRAFSRKRGRSNITVDELVRTITPKGRGLFNLHSSGISVKVI